MLDGIVTIIFILKTGRNSKMLASCRNFINFFERASSILQWN